MQLQIILTIVALVLIGAKQQTGDTFAHSPVEVLEEVYVTDTTMPKIEDKQTQSVKTSRSETHDKVENTDNNTVIVETNYPETTTPTPTTKPTNNTQTVTTANETQTENPVDENYNLNNEALTPSPTISPTPTITISVKTVTPLPTPVCGIGFTMGEDTSGDSLECFKI
jgi:hypothetical protein